MQALLSKESVLLAKEKKHSPLARKTWSKESNKTDTLDKRCMMEDLQWEKPILKKEICQSDQDTYREEKTDKLQIGR